MSKTYVNENFPHFLYGGDYNPDQWVDYPGIVDEDMRLMKLAACNEMTVGLFAWSMIEPSEGVFEFDYFDKVLDKIYENGGVLPEDMAGAVASLGAAEDAAGRTAPAVERD